MPVVWSDRCLLHEPGGESWVGVRRPAAAAPPRHAWCVRRLVLPEQRGHHRGGPARRCRRAGGGFAGESGGGNLNLPLAPGSGDGRWLEAIEELTARAHAAETLVVALGVDAAGGDPESPLEVTPAAFRRAGELLGGLGVPTVVVREGGDDLDAIGPLVRETLLGLETGRP
jgi:acetoin utilization deacetylase AcuC-like enzyme